MYTVKGSEAKFLTLTNCKRSAGPALGTQQSTSIRLLNAHARVSPLSLFFHRRVPKWKHVFRSVESVDLVLSGDVLLAELRQIASESYLKKNNNVCETA